MFKKMLCLAALLCCQTANATFVVRGDLLEEEKMPVFKALFSEDFPDLNEVKASFPRLSFEFLPLTAYQVLEYSIRPKEEQNKWSKVFNLIDFTTFDKYSTINPHSQPLQPGSFWLEDFFLMNDRIKEMGNNAEELKRAARNLLENGSNRLKKNLSDFIPLALYDRVIPLEEMAFQQKHLLLWRFTKGVPSEQLPLDSVLKISDTGLPTADLFEGCENNHGFSYALGLLDGIEKDAAVLVDPYDDYNSVSSPGNPLAFLRTQHLQIARLKEENTGEAQSRLNTLSQRTLYFLSVPFNEVKNATRFFYDPRRVVLPFMRAQAAGEYFHPIFLCRAKTIEAPTIYDHIKTLKHSYTETKEDRQHLAETWFRWMAAYLEIVYTGNQFVTGDSGEALKQKYRDFYNKQSTGLLNR